jgi:hypothetical protein
MQGSAVHECQCPGCKAGDAVVQERHRLTNLFLSRLDEDHRRWFVALQALDAGHGGDCLWSQISGLDTKTIRRGRRELANGLAGFPAERMRRAGGGRTRLKKKIRPSSQT